MKVGLGLVLVFESVIVVITRDNTILPVLFCCSFHDFWFLDYLLRPGYVGIGATLYL